MRADSDNFSGNTQRTNGKKKKKILILHSLHNLLGCRKQERKKLRLLCFLSYLLSKIDKTICKFVEGEEYGKFTFGHVKVSKRCS